MSEHEQHDRDDDILRDILDRAVGIARELYSHGQAFGPDANISFRLDGHVYITREECPLYDIGPDDFACVSTSGKPLNNLPACPELPIHLAIYRQRDDIRAVIHAHGTHSVLWSCLDFDNPYDVIPTHTPHLSARVGAVALLPCDVPRDMGLWPNFERHMNGSKAYLLKNHGAITGGTDLPGAYHNLRQIEESARIAWTIKTTGVKIDF